MIENITDINDKLDKYSIIYKIKNIRILTSLFYDIRNKQFYLTINNLDTLNYKISDKLLNKISEKYLNTFNLESVGKFKKKLYCVYEIKILNKNIDLS